MALTKIPPSGVNTEALDEVLDISRALTDLTDVDLTTPATSGQALVYDTATSTWKPGNGGISSATAVGYSLIFGG